MKVDLFSVNPYVCWLLFLDSYLRRSQVLQAGECQVGNIDTLVANILVYFIADVIPC